MRHEKANYESLVHYETITQKKLIILAYRVLSEERISNGKQKKKKWKAGRARDRNGDLSQIECKGKIIPLDHTPFRWSVLHFKLYIITAWQRITKPRSFMRSCSKILVK